MSDRMWMGACPLIQRHLYGRMRVTRIASQRDPHPGFPRHTPEDDTSLAPAHALHFCIRAFGGGAYSHWQNRLLFSTSDNSNPNSNGRVYSFDLQG